MAKVNLKPSNTALQKMHEIGTKKDADHNLDGCNGCVSQTCYSRFRNQLQRVNISKFIVGIHPSDPPIDSSSIQLL